VTRVLRYRDALNEALREEMERDEGQDGARREQFEAVVESQRGED